MSHVQKWFFISVITINNVKSHFSLLQSCIKIYKSDFLYCFVTKMMIKYIKIKILDGKICKILKIEWKNSWIKFTKLWNLNDKILGHKTWMVKFIK